MSAQAGVWNFDGKPVDQAFLGKLTSAIDKYGADGGKTYGTGSIALAHRAFHTTHESRLEHQPYSSARGNIITWDGRLDNREELIHEFREELTTVPTDVAIVAAAFEHWHTESFRRIVGDWALSIWRPAERQLLFACDYMAIRHIFYYPKKDSIWWSTDLASLVLLSDDKLHIDDDYIGGYFANEPDARLTPYQEIREVPPGEYVHVRSDGKVSIHRYWSFSPSSRILYKTDQEYEEHFRHVFRQSVRRRLRSDSPILAELSGGLDSSSIVCMADDILLKEGAETPRLDTLSLYDKSEPRGDDWLYFPKVEEKRGRAGAHIDAGKYGDSDSLQCPEFSALPGYLNAGSEITTERATVIKAGGYKVVLSGIGGDEFMGGVPNPTAHLADLILRFKFVRLAKQLTAWSLVKRRPWIQLLWEATLDLLPSSIGQYFVKQAKVDPWIDSDFARRTKLAVRQLDVDEHFGFRLPTRRSYISGIVIMANKLAKSISPALTPEEVRYPYLDRDVIEFTASIPAGQLLRPGERRSLMRRALADIVPQEILSRRTKQVGARTPVIAMEKHFDEIEPRFNNSAFGSQLGYINHVEFLRSLYAARDGKAIHVVRMLKTISLEFWLRDLAARRLMDAGLVSSQAIIPDSVQSNA
jgi:asparagine synthase (glutamine-hydrolysing)